MPSLNAKCVRCKKEYGDHSGPDCPDRNTEFLAEGELPEMDDICGNCSETWGDHFGPHGSPETYCREDDWIRVRNGDITTDQVSKIHQFSFDMVDRIFDKNQTPTAIGDKILFRLFGGAETGLVGNIERTPNGYAAPIFIIKYNGSNYERFQCDVESICED